MSETSSLQRHPACASLRQDGTAAHSGTPPLASRATGPSSGTASGELGGAPPLLLETAFLAATRVLQAVSARGGVVVWLLVPVLLVLPCLHPPHLMAEPVPDSIFDTSSDRLFFNSTARVPPRGTRTVGSYAFFLVPHVGVTPLDGVQVGVGFPMPGLLSGGYLAPSMILGGKIGLLAGTRVKAAVSGLRMGGGGEDAIHVGQGIVTLEGERAALTVAVARIWKDHNWGNESVVTLGGEYRAGPGVKLIAESHVFRHRYGEDERTLFVGPRFTDGRATVDMAAWIPLEEGQGPAVPILNLAWTW